MEFAVEFKINDGRAQAPPFTVEVNSPYQLYELGSIIEEEFVSDHGAVYGIGSVLTIERIK